ncbi:PREDICTED: small integral membrane protein 14-like [Amphimedon queenslandica]|uniref:Small integral membrane protein 14 n=1 Tax=Amphimedon queenslandica TaxID=400682 RepID=A0A1X7UEW1_AMPQE|nr:PREDICTED: small integral membrane protein 14-like [Amphimedon queenslandica]|eukprot:XP_011405374.1 PREDICTED: small integral membrane protein 14-like [Amphimedon queenslandica]
MDGEECVCACICAMRRLMEAIKMSQNLCTDTGCLDGYPALPQPPFLDEYTKLLLLMLLAFILAILLFLYRPKSLRSGHNGSC